MVRAIATVVGASVALLIGCSGGDESTRDLAHMDFEASSTTVEDIGSPHDEEVDWQLAGEPLESTVEVRAVFGGSSCTGFKEWQVDESSTEVEVRAIVTFSGAAECTADEVHELHTITLDEPLGTRRLTGCEPRDPDAVCSDIAPDPALGDAGSRP